MNQQLERPPDSHISNNFEFASRLHAHDRMGDLRRCTANSPFCCCDSNDFVVETNISVKRKQLFLGKSSKKAALLQSK